MSWIGKLNVNLSRLWRAMKTSSRFHSFLVFLGFVVVAAVFWLVMALNDSVQDSYTVKIQIANAPDSVTFISEVPGDLHVSVRDRGSSLLRTAILKHPVMTLNFRDYASNGILRVTKADMNAQLKSTFGASAVILSSSPDSLVLDYTTNKGKRVPVVIVSDISPAAGKYLQGPAKADPEFVMVFGSRDVLDTLHRVFTTRIVKRDVSENETYHVALNKIKGVRTVPGSVMITVNVEPLVSKTEVIPISIIGVPKGESLLLFPSQVTVEYFIPMSRFSTGSATNMRAEVEYLEALHSHTGKVHVSLEVSDEQVLNPHLKTDSVEYTIVH